MNQNWLKLSESKLEVFLESRSLLATASRNLLFIYGDFRIFFPSKCGEFLRFAFPPKRILGMYPLQWIFIYIYIFWGRRGVKFRQIFFKHTTLMTLSMLMAIVCKLSLYTNRWSDEFSFLLPAVDDDTCMKEKKMGSVHAGGRKWRQQTSEVNYKKMWAKLWGRTCNNSRLSLFLQLSILFPPSSLWVFDRQNNKSVVLRPFCSVPTTTTKKVPATTTGVRPVFFPPLVLLATNSQKSKLKNFKVPQSCVFKDFQ